MHILCFFFSLKKIISVFCILLLHFQVAKYKDPRDACAAIVAESYRLWLQYETRTDDITVIVVHINGLTDVSGLVAYINLRFIENNIAFFLTGCFLNSPFCFCFPFFCQSAVGQSTSPGAFLRPPVPQVIEVTGSESPSTFSWNSRNHRVRHDLSRARLRAIESSLENGQVWVPSSPAHRKTWEEEVNICLYIFYFCIWLKLV